MSEELQKWLPTLDAARALGPLMVHRGWFRGEVDLWTMPVKHVETLAAIALSGRLARRDQWRRDEEVSERRYAEISNAEQPTANDWIPRLFARVVEAGRLHNCTQCHPGKPGKSPCHHCGGTGDVLSQGGVVYRCRECDDGAVVCACCEGTNRTVQTKFEYIEDKIESFSSLILPDVAPKLSWWLHAQLNPRSTLNECLLFRLDQLLELAPYRGSSVHFEPDFHGFKFGGAFDRSRDGLRAIVGRSEVFKSEYRAYARGVLVVHFDDGSTEYDAAFVVSDEQQLQGFATKIDKHPE
jgi:hypothetical protein